MVLGIPSIDGVVVVLVQEQPVLLAVLRLLVRAVLGVGPDQDEAAAQLLAVHVGVQLAVGDRCRRVVGAVRLPGPVVPHDDVTAAVLAARDDPLEVGVLQGMVLDVHRHPPDRRVEGRALGHRPRGQGTVDLEAQVVVQVARPVALHHEVPGTVLVRGPRVTGRLGR
jgi:hypothetical protein